MSDAPPDPPTGAGTAHLGRVLALTRLSLLVERLARAFWPLASVLAGAWAVWAFAGAELLRRGWGPGAALAAGLCALAALVWGLWRLRLPSRAEAEAALDATLPGRPLAALRDRMALGGPGAERLWQAHRARMAARAAAARPPVPRADLAPRDPAALRLVAGTALVMALVFATPPAPMAGRATPEGPAWEGWAEPPRYTGLPVIYLNALEGDTLTLPVGSRLSLRLYDDLGRVEVTQDLGAPLPGGNAAAPGPIRRLEIAVNRSGSLALDGPGGRRLAVGVVPDAPPVVEIRDLAQRRADGKLVQPFRARDDYGVTGGVVRLTLDLDAVSRRHGLALAPEPRPPLDFPLPVPLTGSRRDFAQTLVQDAARHPWANLPVVMEITARDGAGQEGRAAPVHLDLPGRRFFNPLAAALIEMRRDLLWSRANAPRVAEILRAITWRPEGFIDDARAFLTLRMVIRQLDAAIAAGGLAPATRDEIAEALWSLAETFEDGGLSDALAAMKRAQERLSEAIRNGATSDEIARLMEDLRKATDDYLRQLAQQGEQRDPAERFAGEPPSREITQDQIQTMMDEIARLMEEGRMAEAQERLDQLAQILENLQMRAAEGPGQGPQGPGGQALRDLTDTLRGQQDLSDETFRQMQEGPGGPAPGGDPGAGDDPGQGAGGGQGEGQGEGAAGGDLAERQRDLREELGRQRGLLPRTGTEEGDAATRRALDEAGRAMEEAEDALREGDTGRALERQAEAIGRMREGMRQLSENLSGDGDGQRQPGAGDGRGQAGREVPRDPLGRNAGQGARIGTDESLLGTEDIYRRARDLLDEIRRRAGEQARPDAERDYLRRLLDRF
ncbi:DUF4175 domain-containing protein [Phaeovulum vinaykumarii]|uniref:TIGR02302 family protein n=1 Tax=Phaeovulum vinaykumarii TaxID=407234 RepID=A0A1N7KQN7_9RHOB|nr:DUF4175 family protein [Phaeovulum vinaykumarii]SIS63908.1 TIGR02302 family protein [Phaeovulum vinaykumarii]SOC01739.1 uncharacterized protein (TIGR02302 family) [Phaeovulum vinaykumarii]